MNGMPLARDILLRAGVGSFLGYGLSLLSLL